MANLHLPLKSSTNNNYQGITVVHPVIASDHITEHNEIDFTYNTQYYTNDEMAKTMKEVKKMRFLFCI